MLIENSAVAQDSSQLDLSVTHLSSKTLRKLSRRYTGLTLDLNSQQAALLQKLQRQEDVLKHTIPGQDSALSTTLFLHSSEQYQQLRARLESKGNEVSVSTHYIAGLDSLRSALGFLEKSRLNTSPEKLSQIKTLGQQISELQAGFEHADILEEFMKRREAQLTSGLSSLGMDARLLGVNKEIYYYRQQLVQYRAALENPDKVEEEVLKIVSRLPAFQQYWQSNSLLAQLFPQPEGYGTPTALNGLQTTAQLTTMIQRQIGSASLGGASTANPLPIPDSYLQKGQDQLNQLKEQVANAGGTNSDVEIPRFQPNGQHGKSLLRRLTYGFDIQTASADNYLPSIEDLALKIGVKISDKIETGVGASYKLGLGRLNCVHFTNEGIGARTYLDVKAKGSLWFSGGWEYNYLQRFASLRDLHRNVDVWQKSALLGLTKKYKIGKREGLIQLLYDFLAKNQVPVAQPLKFRTGFNF